jgi:hypothetical protein
MRKNKKMMELVYLEWSDALYTSDWINERHIDNWAESSDWIVKHVGWLIRETPKYIVISSRMNNNSDGKVNEYGALQKIPKTWIKIRKKLK